MKKRINDIMIAGFALFAMFLGAGNMIFPPTLGANAGTSWLASLLGFLITGVGFPVLGVISMTLSKGEVEEFTKNLSPWFSTLLISTILLIIGPLFAIPRTAATTYEIGVHPFLTGMLNENALNIAGIVARLVFFIATFIFVLNPGKVIDTIGKFLTPILIIVLALVIGKGIFAPLGTPAPVEDRNFFLIGFRGGYQTMDALGSILLAIIVIESLIARGYKGRKTLFSMTAIIGLIACIGLALVYTGLAYLGASSSGLLAESMDKTDRLVKIVDLLWGRWGKTILGLSISFACLTTSVGLTTIGGEYFSKKLKLPYKPVVAIITIISFFISIVGVEGIILFAGPILEIVYPVVIALIFINFFARFLPNCWFTRGAIIGTLLVSLSLGVTYLRGFINTVFKTSLDFTATRAFLDKLPLAGIGLSWIVPAIVLGIICGVIAMFTKSCKK
ncbi:MAG: branched-chain amino acid transport system II carrier protein [Treponema sp.]|nr:MAG: branched-chain amino acid transport system II carrier protein [Treponema sp.]